MSKRFTDTDKWKKVWFRQLSPKLKSLWIYLLDNCNHAGIWEVDFGLAEVFIGEKLDEDEIRKVFSKQYIELREGTRWLLKDFINFQYGECNKDNRMYVAIENALRKEGVCMGDIWGIDARKVKDKVKDKVMVIVKEQVKDKEIDSFKRLYSTADKLRGHLKARGIEEKEIDNIINKVFKAKEKHSFPKVIEERIIKDYSTPGKDMGD